MRFATGFIVVVLASSSFANTWSFTFSCGKEEKEICLEGKHKAGAAVVVLDEENTKPFKAKVGRAVKQESEAGQPMEGHLLQFAGKKPSRAFLAIQGMPAPKYEKLELKNSSPAKADELKRLGSLAKQLEEVKKTAAASGGHVEGYVKQGLNFASPKVSEFSEGGKTYYLLKYGAVYEDSGPVLFSDGKEIHTLTALCGGLSKVFRLNGVHYFQIFSSWCCECGDNVLTLETLEKGKLRELVSTSMFAT